MNGDEENEIKTTVERIGRRISESGEVKRYRYIERVDEKGTVHKITEFEKCLNSCGHYGDAGGNCWICQSFTICKSCAKTSNFLCSVCHQACCPNCSTENLIHKGVRYCNRCWLSGMFRNIFRR